MATRCDTREGVTLKESCSGVSNTLTESAPRVQETNRSHDRHNCKYWKYSYRSIGSRSLLLLLTWQFIIQCSLGFTLKHFIFNFQLEEDSLDFWISSQLVVQERYILGIATLSCVLVPIISLLAEVVIGQYRLVSFSLKAMWLLSIVGSVFSIYEEAMPMDKTKLFTFHLIVFVTPYIFLGAFVASVVPLGIDQIIGGSAANISALIQWLFWAFVSGRTIENIISSIIYKCSDFQTAHMLMPLLPVLLFSMGLVLDFHFHHKLVKEPVTFNPVSLIFKVLKYAAKHKYPVQRSAFTYCENEQPTRLDYGKSKYGGPFTTEQVEDVKTFWRVLLVLLVIVISAIPLAAEYVAVIDMDENFSSFKSETNCVQNVLQAILTPGFHITYSIPLYELLIYPCLRNRGPNILQSAGIGAAALIVTSLYGIVVESTRNTLANQCSFTQYTETFIDIPYNFMLGFTAIVLPKSSIEFVCAQAPYNMIGVLIGLLLTFLTLFITIGALLFEVFKQNWFHSSTCGIWFYLTTLVLAVMSSALLGLVIRWYKARERDEITSSQDLVEEIYHKYQEQATHD